MVWEKRNAHYFRVITSHPGALALHYFRPPVSRFMHFSLKSGLVQAWLGTSCLVQLRNHQYTLSS